MVVLALLLFVSDSVWVLFINYLITHSNDGCDEETDRKATNERSTDRTTANRNALNRATELPRALNSPVDCDLVCGE